MKRNYFFCFCLVLLFSFVAMSCTGYRLVTAAPDEWLITVPTTGDTTQQGSLDSFEAYKGNLVSGKTIYIPVKRVVVATNGSKNLKRKIPLAKAYVTKRTPITRTYYNEKVDGKELVGDMPGFATETQGSIGVTTGFTFTIHVAEPAKYLYWRSAQTDYFDPIKSGDKTELANFCDTIVYPEAQRIVSEWVASVPDAQMTSKKAEFYNKLKDDLVSSVGVKYGIEFDSISPKGGFIYDDPEIQDKINKQLKNNIDASNAQSELAAQKARAELIPYEKAWAEINMKKALILYVEKAAVSGKDIFPKAIGSGAVLDISQYMK